jgi:4-amino-4-deoxy-L-arabinose transferase-like glycosyltransferase
MEGALERLPRQRWLLYGLTGALALVGLACLDHTRRSLSGTFDEPNHLAAGLEWWQFGTYTQWTENPPLARVAVAALPYFHGMRLPPATDWDPRTHDGGRIWEVGGDLLYSGAGFETNIGRARLGTLPFFLLALAVCWALADGRRRPLAGLVAVGLSCTLPALIAHGALATTDMAFAATFLLAVLALWRWFEAPTRSRCLALALALALALLTKFTLLLFFPILTLAFVAARRIVHLPTRPTADGAPLAWSRLLVQLALGLLALALVSWAGYRFSIGCMDNLVAQLGQIQILTPMAERTSLERLLLGLPLPMPELFHGLLFLAKHSQMPPPAYLLGQVSESGFLAFYPVTLAVKTPPPLLVLLLLSAVVTARARRAPLWPALALQLGALGIVAVSATSSVDLGIRHVFVVLPLLAVASGRASDAWIAQARGYRQRLGAGFVGALLLAQAAIAVGALSKELGYVNVLAAHDPGAVLLDSDLDWGQDLFALRRELELRNVERLSIAYFGTARLCQHGLPVLTPLVPGQEATGWIAISENFYRQRNYFGLLADPCDPHSWYDRKEIPPQPFAWLRAYQPVSIVGTSIRLYHIVAEDEH